MNSKFNTDIDLSTFKVINKEILLEIHNEFKIAYGDKVPEEFNWCLLLKDDTNELINKKKLMSPVKNQHLCGCCWAIACTSAISDCYVVRGLVTWSPKVSYTYALSKYPQQKCSGGSSRVLLEDIKNGEGIASDFCVDEQWCLSNKDCISNKASDHFFKSDKNYLSSLIPSTGCYDDTKKHYVYTVTDVYSLTASENIKVLEAQDTIKKHIMTRGPVVGGFLIMENFINGDFSKENKGIYFENIDTPKIIGSHSVVIVGWGVEKNVKFNDIVTNVPYWYCRNSWGEQWGESGYFKIAMYPFNKVCQFSKKVRVLQNKTMKEVGGITGFLVTEPPQLQKLKCNNMSELIQQKFIGVDENDFINNSYKIVDIVKDKECNYIIITVAVILAFIILFTNDYVS